MDSHFKREIELVDSISNVISHLLMSGTISSRSDCFQSKRMDIIF
jgi:hypothetical protein